MGWEEDKASVMEGLKKLDSINEVVEKMTKQVEGTEELTQKFKQEVGEVRKGIEELKASGVDAEIIKKLVDKVDALGENNNSSLSDDSQGRTKSDKDWDEKQLSESAKAKADEVYSKLTTEEKADIANNPSKRKKFLQAAQDATEEVPDSLFEKKSENKPAINDYRRLFGMVDKEANHIPGLTSSSSRYAGTQSHPTLESTQKVKRLPGGILPKGGQNNE